MHFSEHHISLAPYPMDSEYHLICRTPLQQRLTVQPMDFPVACDRLNMVKYVPELGLVVAASQKGRVAIISLTWQEEIGYAFRVDWIVPFFTQEANDDRPWMPLHGMAVSPMPGFEIPQDVPSIPRRFDPNDCVDFNYRILNPENNDSSSSISSTSSSRSSAPSTKRPKMQPVSSKSDRRSPTESHSQTDSESGEDSSSDEDRFHGPLKSDQPDYTLPELHAEASRAYRPHERWHGWHPSRHYRLLLLYCDHTVMSYEFWHDWKIS